MQILEQNKKIIFNLNNKTKSFKNYYTSEISKLNVKDILKKRICKLDNFKKSSQNHLILLNFFLNHLKINLKKTLPYAQ